MKLYSFITYFMVLVTLTSAIPVGKRDSGAEGTTSLSTVETRTLEELLSILPEDADQITDDLYEAINGHLQDSILKRDYAALTVIFTSLNQSGQGVAIVKAFATNPLTQKSVIEAVAGYIQQKTLLTILEAANQSGLAFDIVMSFFTDYKVVPGAIVIGKALFANGTLKKRSLFGDIFGGVTSAIGGIFGIATTSATPTVATATSVPTTLQTVATTAAGVSIPTAVAGITIPTLSVPSIAGVTIPTLSVPSVAGGDIFSSLLAGVAGATTTPTTATTATPVATTKKTSSTVATTAATSTAAATTSSSSGGLLSGIFDGISSLLTGASSTASSAADGVTSTIGSTIGSIISGITSTVNSTLSDLGSGDIGGAIGSAVGGTVGTLTNVTSTALSGLESSIGSVVSGTQSTLISTVISLIKNVGDLEELCESLQISGLGVSVVKSFFTDSDMQVFTEELVNYIVVNKVVTLGSLIGALTGSGVIIDVFEKIISTDGAIGTIFAFIAWFIGNISTLL